MAGAQAHAGPEQEWQLGSQVKLKTTFDEVT